MQKGEPIELPKPGVVIRRWREFRGKSSSELAAEAGLTVQYLSQMENGRIVHPTDDRLFVIAKALRIPLKVLLSRELPRSEHDIDQSETHAGRHQTFLFLQAHPDDCIIACGGTIAYLVDQGHDVNVMTLSAGERSGTGRMEELRNRRASRDAE